MNVEHANYTDAHESRKNSNSYKIRTQIVADTRGLQLSKRDQAKLIAKAKNSLKPNYFGPRYYYNVNVTQNLSSGIFTYYIEKDMQRGFGDNQLANNRIFVSGIYIGYYIVPDPIDLLNGPQPGITMSVYQTRIPSDQVTNTTFIGDNSEKQATLTAFLATRSGYVTPNSKTLINRTFNFDDYNPNAVGRINRYPKCFPTEFVDGNSASTVSGGHFLQVLPGKQTGTNVPNWLFNASIQIEYYYA